MVERDGEGLLYMETRTLLDENTSYTISFFPGIVDINGLILEDTTKIEFKTEKNTYASGTVVDNFEAYFGWKNPFQNETSTGLTEDGTSFTLSSAKVISGTFSGKLEYEFSSDTGGVCRLENEERISIPNKSESEFGIWIYGDFSFNDVVWIYNVSLRFAHFFCSSYNYLAFTVYTGVVFYFAGIEPAMARTFVGFFAYHALCQ